VKYARKDDDETSNSLLDVYQTTSTRDVERLTSRDNSKRINTTNYKLIRNVYKYS